MNQVSGAPITMHKKGQSTDAAVLKEILKKPGITVAEIAESLIWTNGKVDGSVNRLVAEGEAYVTHNLKRGMLIKLVYPSGFEKKPANLIEIPKELVNAELWMEKAYVYALSRTTIGIAHQEVAEWREKAITKDRVPVRKDENIVLELPERVVDFYELANSETSLSAVGDLVLVTVETVLPVKVPVKRSEETKYAVVQTQ